MEKKNTKEKILNSAIRVFGREGYANASLTYIAADARVSQSFVSKTYLSKENLFLEAFQSVVSEMLGNCGEDAVVPDAFEKQLDYLKKLSVEDPAKFLFLSTYA